MSDSVERAFQELRREYLGSMPTRLEELSSDAADFRAGSPAAADSLKTRLHRLAGSAGSYGFLELSRLARDAEQWLATRPSADHTAQLDSLLDRLRAASDSAEAELAPRVMATQPPITPRALIIMRSSPERDCVAQELRGTGYEVRLGTRHEDPERTPEGELPHLIVIGGEAGDGDPSAVASAWTRNLKRRPGAVVLIETLRGVDRLRAVAAGVDAVFPAEEVQQKLLRYARVFARIGPPPSVVMLIEEDPSLAARIAVPLEEADIKVVSCPPGPAVMQTLERESPDLLLLNTAFANADAFALARLVRQDVRYQLMPIVFLGSDDHTDRIAALRAGADDLLPVTVPPELLTQTVIARAARGRRMREAVHRDTATGLLNHPTLVAELEHAVEYSRKHSEPLAFVLFELDGFRQIHRRMGPRVADEVLLHMAGIFRSNVRASDVIGRYGGEAFGMLLRGSSATGAAVLAEKLRRVLGEQPAMISSGQTIPLQVSVGTAVFPRDGVTAAELLQAAGRRVGE